MWATFLFIGYLFPLLILISYSLVQAILAFRYQRSRQQNQRIPPPFETLPWVTIQLPLYNERFVVERLIRQIALQDYPHWDVQILDDSTDETTQIVASTLATLPSSIAQRFALLHRENRIGFKAGALAWGLPQAKGEFIAIFDADFLPQPDFLTRLIPHFQDASVGVVQSRWGHLNENYSLFTQLQAFGLNAHFTIEQQGRQAGGNFINFNGTAGIWRKTTIQDAGGWSADTLTEDLDLSYRAQMKGWKFVYREDVVSPAELPVTLPAIRAQQYRWMKGGAECFRKALPLLWKNKQITQNQRWHGIAHLFNSSLFLGVWLTGIFSLPLAYEFQNLPFDASWLGFFQFNWIVLAYFYWTSQNNLGFFPFLWRFLAFLTLMMGLSIHNSLAVWEAYRGKKSPFIRTPKFNLIGKTDLMPSRWEVYKAQTASPLLWIELAFALYFSLACYLDVVLGFWGLIPFHGMFALGLWTLLYTSFVPQGIPR